MRIRILHALTAFALILSGSALSSRPAFAASAKAGGESFEVVETTISQVHAAYKSGRLTAHQLVQAYLDRINAYDKQGPKINCVISLNPKALEDADRLDAQFKASGMVGPMHGIPVLVKDQVDAAGMPTTLGSVIFKDYKPPLDSFVVAKLRKAGAIILGKTTLGEFGGGDAYGSLFGVSRNPYDPERTVGGSSGGSGACTSANFATVAVGEEGFASIRRPSSWNDLAGMRPSPGITSRTGIYAGWPEKTGQLGPIARTVEDLAKLLDGMAGYDTDDPLTSLGVGQIPDTYTKLLDKNGLKGARIGILREPMGRDSEPDSEDFKKVDAVFQKNVAELKAAGATVIDPIVIPDLKKLMATRASMPGEADESIRLWMSRNPESPYKTLADVRNSPDIAKIIPAPKAAQWMHPPNADMAKYYAFLQARDQLAINVMKVMADNKLDAIVHKSVEHQPTFIKDGINPPYTNEKGAPSLNTFLIYAASMTVPSGFTTDNLPTGITFFGRSFSEPTLLKLAYAYEQATHHRIPPKTTPALSAAK